MRTLVLSIFTAFVLVLGYMAYWWMQPADTSKTRARDRIRAPMDRTTRQSDQPFGPGKGAWVKKYNSDTGELVSRYKGEEYLPRNDGWIEVKKPRAQFFMKDGRVICVDGDTGEMIMDSPGQKSGMQSFSGSRDTPNRGRLKGNVRISLYHTKQNAEVEMDETRWPAMPADQRPHLAMTISLNNASFDNQTFKIYSEGYYEARSHKRVEADQVAVVLKGDDYDFMGHGLVIRWNQRDQQLLSLQVAHGKELIIKHPGNVLKKNDTAVAIDDLPGVPLPFMFAARGRAAVAEAIAGSTRPATGPSTRRARAGGGAPHVTKPKPQGRGGPALYRAIFHDDVRITQGAELLVTANKMSVDFLMQDDSDAPTTRPATRPTTLTAATAPATRPASRPTSRRTVRRTFAATRPANETPVVINWTGPLVVEPLQVGVETPLPPGEAIVRLDGSPVTATQQDSTILCGTLTYRTMDQMMLLTPMGPDQPVVLKDAKGTVVQTRGMDWSQTKRQAVLTGASTAVFPQEDEHGKPSQPLHARWSKTCTLHFRPAARGAGTSDMEIEKAELDGDVNVDHPQLKLKSQTLELGFEPAARPQGAQTRPASADHATTLAARDLAQLDQKIQALTEALAKSPGLDASAHAVEKAESDLASAAADVKRLADAAAPVPPELSRKRDELAAAYAARKSEFEQQQKQVMELQDLKTERQSRARRLGDERPAQPATAPATRPTSRPAMRADLRHLLATGQVHCDMTDNAKKTQTIDCDRLSLLTASAGDGKIYPSVINADGDVRAVDPEQDLRAGHLAVTLRPATQPSKARAGGGGEAAAELQSLIAHNNVVVVSKDGTIARADQLLIDNKDGRNNLKLLGQPATIVDKKNTLTGPIIEINPDTQQLEVVGAGTMKGTQQDKPDQPARPLDVSWARSLSFDGKANTVDVAGNVSAISKDPDGTVNTATGQRVRMLLADVPSTRPSRAPATQAAQPAAAAAAVGEAPATNPSTRPAKANQYSSIATKTVRQIIFNDSAEVSAVLLNEQGLLLRRTVLQSQTIDYDLLGKKLTIPVEGRMVVEDHRAPTKLDRPEDKSQENRGTTAFQWTKRFTYDDSTRLAVMEGDLARPVLIVHREDAQNPRTFSLQGDTVTAELEAMPAMKPAPGGETRPAGADQPPGAATKPAAGAEKRPADDQQRMQMKRVTARGHLRFKAPGAEIFASAMEYDPRTHWLVARGDGNNPVDFDIQSSHGGRQVADEVQYNTETGDSRAVNARVRMVR